MLHSLLKQIQAFLVSFAAAVAKGYETVLSDLEKLRSGTANEFASLQNRFDLLEVKQAQQTELINRILKALLPGPAVSISIVVFDPVTGETLELQNGETMIQNRHTTRTVSLVPKDADGNVTTLDGPATVASNTPAVTITELSADGLSFKMRTEGVAGSGQVSIQGDGDLGTGQSEIIATVDITVPAGNAITLVPTIGDEIPNDPPAT